jgi:kumamolisin
MHSIRASCIRVRKASQQDEFEVFIISVISGTVTQMENAFQVKLFNYDHPEGNYRGRVGAVGVPAEVRDIVQGVFGLDNRHVAERRRHPVHELSKSRTLRIPSSWYIPSQLAT